MNHLTSLIQKHKNGEAVGIYSVCSAHPLVLRAAILQAKKDRQPVLIEATSNQVNQFGGYTGMTPADFADCVFTLADELNFARNNVILGGDHLGPNCWQKKTAEEAMALSEQLIYDYVAAGFSKIHLDCSMPCADDVLPLPESLMAERAARLCAIAEQSWQENQQTAPVYVIGTEVPTPGGALESLQDATLQVTTPEQAEETLSAHQIAFAESGLTHVWPRVIGLVVQPGVEFDHHSVHHYCRVQANSLAKMVESQPYLVFEAHSTDYQNPETYHDLVQDHFAILKVGPALTFALREALFALDQAQLEWLGPVQSAHLRSTIERVMREEPDYWHSHYHSQGHQQYLDCSYSLSDRIRYYWTHSKVQQAQHQLFDNLTKQPLPTTLLSQYLPNQVRAIAQEKIQNTPADIVIHKVMEVMEMYAQACFSNAAVSKETL